MASTHLHIVDGRAASANIDPEHAARGGLIAVRMTARDRAQHAARLTNLADDDYGRGYQMGLRHAYEAVEQYITHLLADLEAE